MPPRGLTGGRGDVDLAVDNDDPRPLVHLVLLQLFPGEEVQHDRPRVLSRGEDRRLVWLRLDGLQIPAPHAPCSTRDMRELNPFRRGPSMGSVERDELRAVQAPLKERYQEEPEAALVTLAATGTLGEGISCSVNTGRALAEAGLHPASGGDGSLLCSGDMLLEALAACAGVTLRAVATSLGITVESGTVRAEGDLDFRGTLAVDRDAPVGFRAIRLSFELETEANEEELRLSPRVDRALLRRPADARQLAPALGQRQASRGVSWTIGIVRFALAARGGSRRRARRRGRRAPRAAGAPPRPRPPSPASGSRRR